MDRLAALHLLEEVNQQCRYGKPERTEEIRQALRSLLTPETKRWTVAFWDVLDDDTAFRFGYAEDALGRIYMALGIERDPSVAQGNWKRLYEAQLTPEMRRARGG